MSAKTKLEKEGIRCSTTERNSEPMGVDQPQEQLGGKACAVNPEELILQPNKNGVEMVYRQMWINFFFNTTEE